MKLKVQLKDKTVITKILPGRERFVDKRCNDGRIRFQAEDGRDILMVDESMFAFAEFFEEEYELTDTYRLERAEDAVALLRNRLWRDQWNEVVPADKRYTIPDVKGKTIQVAGRMGEDIIVDAFRDLKYETLEIQPLRILSEMRIREDDIETTSDSDIADTLYVGLDKQILEVCKKMPYNSKKVLFGSPMFKSWLDNDNWYWNIAVKLDVGIYSVEETF